MARAQSPRTQGWQGLSTDGPITTVNVDLSTLSAAADVALGFGQPIREIADIEFQSGPDPALSRRLLLYSAILHHRYDVPVPHLGRVLVQRPHLDQQLRVFGFRRKDQQRSSPIA